MSGDDPKPSADRVAHRLADLVRIGRLVAAIVAKGRDAYLDDGVPHSAWLDPGEPAPSGPA